MNDSLWGIVGVGPTLAGSVFREFDEFGNVEADNIGLQGRISNMETTLNMVVQGLRAEMPDIP